eukprot:1185784-Prorocentrum_minimum.AAC.5
MSTNIYTCETRSSKAGGCPVKASTYPASIQGVTTLQRYNGGHREAIAKPPQGELTQRTSLLPPSASTRPNHSETPPQGELTQRTSLRPPSASTRPNHSETPPQGES